MITFPFPIPGLPRNPQLPGGGFDPRVPDLPPIQIPAEDQTPAPDQSQSQTPAQTQTEITSSSPTSPTSPTVPPQQGAGAMPDWIQFLIWLAALVVLWFILTAASESGYSREAAGMAGLLLVGALMFMGPQAITNAQALIQPRKG